MIVWLYNVRDALLCMNIMMEVDRVASNLDCDSDVFYFYVSALLFEWKAKRFDSGVCWNCVLILIQVVYTPVCCIKELKWFIAKILRVTDLD